VRTPFSSHHASAHKPQQFAGFAGVSRPVQFPAKGALFEKERRVLFRSLLNFN
jgi:hypothetical protein